MSSGLGEVYFELEMIFVRFKRVIRLKKYVEDVILFEFFSGKNVKLLFVREKGIGNSVLVDIVVGRRVLFFLVMGV